jgi:hypothetical protein
MNNHDKYQGRRAYTVPTTNYTIQRGTVADGAIAIDGVIYLDSVKLLQGKSPLGALSQNWHDFRQDLEEPDTI